MFANFIYFIIALLIVTLYEPPEDLPFGFAGALFLLAVTAAVFAIYTRVRFQRLVQRASVESRARLDHRFDQLSLRHSVLALVFFAVDVWWLNLPAYMDPLGLFQVLPTLKSLVLLILFVGYLALLWLLSYDAHRRIYLTDLSRGSYVYSNVAFSIPILIPWTLLFGITDLVRLLPFDLPKRILDSTIGHTSYFLVFLIIAAILAPALIQRFWRCRPLEDGEHRRRIESLCRRAGVAYADIVHWPIFGGRMITAAVMGLVSRFRYILVTDALLQILSPDEIDQVIAHEIGHVKRKHLLLYLMFFMGFILISYTTYPVTVLLLFFNGPFLAIIKLLDLNPFRLQSPLFAALLIIAIIVYFRYVFGYFMRNFERQADAYVFQLYPTAEPLISTFGKIVSTSGQPADKPNWHHFSIQQRVDYLRKCERSPAWIRRQDSKVRKSIAVFLCCIAFLGLASYQLNQLAFSADARHINVSDLEAYLDQKIEKTTEDAVLYWLVGNVYYERQELAKAASAYEAALVLNPDNPDVLNNLAWLLATGDDRDLRDPPRALALARAAIQIKKAPHIWDTLAQSLFANGRIEEAIEAEQRALSMNPEDRQIYEDQLVKFREALAGQTQ